MASKTYKLFAAKGCGSMIVEVAFGIAKVPLKVTYLDWKDLGWESKPLKAINPLGQVPTLVLPDGTVMTESAAILLYLADRVKSFDLVPGPRHKQRAEFLRWLVFLVSAVYPTYTYGDMPERWVGVSKDKGAGKALRFNTDEHRRELISFLEGQIKGPWFLGRTMSALDIYVWVLSRWRPGRDWLTVHCPKFMRIAEALDQHEVFQGVTKRNQM